MFPSSSGYAILVNATLLKVQLAAAAGRFNQCNFPSLTLILLAICFAESVNTGEQMHYVTGDILAIADKHAVMHDVKDMQGFIHTHRQMTLGFCSHLM